MAPRTYNRGTPAERFVKRLIKMPSGCREYQGCRQRKGYGRFAVMSDDVWLAHRFAYVMFVGAIPEGMLILHHCDNPPCCNPEHLYVGTAADNHHDAVSRNRHVAPPNHRGEEVSTAVLTDDLVRTLRRDHIPRVITARMLAERHGLSVAVVKNVLQRRSWAHIE